MSDFQLNPGYFRYYVMRHWKLFKLCVWVALSDTVPGGEWEWESTASLLPGGDRSLASLLGLSSLLLSRAGYSSSPHYPHCHHGGRLINTTC